ncbi:MAG TPA: family 20 glycosylhydrolase, partial [Thermomicrobiales bacterium]|nr:family 20 glycosylhydrolase [Thermomicrobiales bacterium]
EWQTLDYLPKMVTDDLFGQVVAYGMERNVFVRPHFNSPGHNTILPRVYPELSARDDDGNPIGYGFCLSNPRTYDLLFELYDSVIERYLRPNGCDWFHIGLDEVEAYAGIDPRDPSRPVEPWCRCPDCRDKPRARQLQEYAVRVCSHLKEQGITNITMWNDALSKLGAMNEDFARMLDEAGLRENVIVQWWRYNDPVLLPNPDLGVRSWSTPMAGYWSNLFTHSYTSNIYAMLLHGARNGAEGADAYCIYDPAYDRNYACLAEYSWNQPATEDLYQFKSRYTQETLGARLDRHLAAEAFDKYDQAFDSMPWTGTTLSSLLYYWHSYPAARARGEYPRDVFTDIQSSHMRLRQGLASAATHARTARDLFARATPNDSDPLRLLEEYRVECEKLVGVWETFATATDAISRYETARATAAGTDGASVATAAAGQIRAADDRLVAVMADLERVKQPYLLPQILRDMSVLHGYFERLAAAFESAARQVTGKSPAMLPSFHDLSPSQADLDVLVSSAPEAAAVSAD